MLTFDVPGEPKTWQRLATCSEQRIAEINVVLAAYDSLISGIHYCSGAITSGFRLVDALFDARLNSAAELRQAAPQIYSSKVVKPNIAESIGVAKGLASTSEEPVVSPAIFDAASLKWSTPEYMFLWLTLLARKANKVTSCELWEYTIGSVEEYVYVSELNSGLRENDRLIETFEDGIGALRFRRAVRLISGATLDIARRYLDYEPHLALLGRLYEVAKGQHPPTRFATQLTQAVRDDVYQSIDSVRERIAKRRGFMEPI